MKIILATNSKNKVREMKEILEGINGIDEILTMREIGFTEDINESGYAYRSNAMIKAITVKEFVDKHIQNPSDYIILGDDSGFEIKALGGAPGIYSHRFLGEETDQNIKNQKIVDLFKNLPSDVSRDARYVCYICILFNKHNAVQEVSFMYGYVGDEVDKDGKNGFGYDPIFYVNGVSCASMDHETKLELSHRYKALKAIRQNIESIISINGIEPGPDYDFDTAGEICNSGEVYKNGQDK